MASTISERSTIRTTSSKANARTSMNSVSSGVGGTARRPSASYRCAVSSRMDFEVANVQSLTSRAAS